MATSLHWTVSPSFQGTVVPGPAAVGLLASMWTSRELEPWLRVGFEALDGESSCLRLSGIHVTLWPPCALHVMFCVPDVHGDPKCCIPLGHCLQMRKLRVKECRHLSKTFWVWSQVCLLAESALGTTGIG